MSELPKGWVSTKFTDILDVSGGTQPPKSEFIHEPRDGYVRLLQIRDFGEKPVPTYIRSSSKWRQCSEDDILIGRYGASLGRICTGMEGAFNVALAKVVVPEGIDKKFLKYYLKSELFQKPLSMLSRSAQNGFNKSDLSNFDFWFAPLNEQIRIADKLDSILAKVNKAQERLDKIPSILKRFRQSVLSAATSGELTSNFQRTQTLDRALFQQQQKQLWEQAQQIKFESKGQLPKDEKWKEKYQPCSVFELSTDENFPQGWNLFYAQELCSVISDGDHNPPKKVQEGRKHLTVRCIQNGRIDFSHCAYVTEEGYLQTRMRYEPIQGDVLLTCIGSLGRSAIVSEDTDFSTDRNVAYLRLLKGVEPEFIRYALDSQSLQNQIANGAVGNAQQALYLKTIKELVFALPPLDEQLEIIRRINALFSLSNVVEKNWQESKTKLDRLTQSILAKAFRGELVTQDPNDEPASESLKRIKSLAIESKSKKKATPKLKVSSTTKVKIANEAISDQFEQLEPALTPDLDAEKYAVIDRLRDSHQAEIQRAQELLVDAKFSVEQFRSITEFKGGYDELKALIMNLLKGIPNVSEPLLAIESWDGKSGDYLMHLVKQK